MLTITMCLLPVGMKEKKQTSYKVLLGLIVLMFTLQTIHIICDWYIVWLGFIQYGDAPDQALDALEEDGAKFSLRIVGSMTALLTVLRLCIADSIMVSNYPSLPVSTTNWFQLEGLEVLDHM
jgi:hypothetical protein